MRAHGRIDAAARGIIRQHDIVQTLAHAMQTLEFKGGFIGGHIQNRGHGMGVVGGKLRIDPVGHGQKFARMGNIGDIGGLFAGKHRERGQPQNLRALHLGIPIGALDQPHHDLAVQLNRQPIKPVDHRPRAPPIGLHHHAEPVPSAQAFIRQHRLDHLHRQFQPVGLFGVDVEPKARRPRQPRQRPHPWHQFPP